jgi:hypothetical protein
VQDVPVVALACSLWNQGKQAMTAVREHFLYTPGGIGAAFYSTLMQLPFMLRW